MKRNILPFVIIAVVGVLSAIIVFYVGVDQREDIQQAEENGEETEENGEEGETDDPEAIFESNCASCHGDDLSGGMGPDLTEVGSRDSEDEINDIIMNGKGDDMPAGLVEADEADALAEWLADME